MRCRNFISFLPASVFSRIKPGAKLLLLLIMVHLAPLVSESAAPAWCSNYPVMGSWIAAGYNTSAEFPDIETCKTHILNALQFGPLARLGWWSYENLSVKTYDSTQTLHIWNGNGWMIPDDPGGGDCSQQCYFPDPPNVSINLMNECGNMIVEISASEHSYPIPSFVLPHTVTYITPDGLTASTSYPTGAGIGRDILSSVSLTVPDGTTHTINLPTGTAGYAASAWKSFSLSDFGLSIDQLRPATGTYSVTVRTQFGGEAATTGNMPQSNSGLSVTVVPDKLVVEPTLPPRRNVAQNGENEAPVTVTVMDQNGVPATGANVTLSVERASVKYGGHDHDAATVATSTRPRGTMKVPSGTTDASGVFTSTYKASDFAAEDKIKASASFQGCSGEAVSAPIAAQVQGLVLWGNVPGVHRSTGGTCNHHGPSDYTVAKVPTECRSPDNNHWLTQASQTKLSMLLDAYYAKYPSSGLRPNDASLPYGGRFDIDGNWAGDHETHRRGEDMDIGFFDVYWANVVTEKKLRLLNEEEDGLLFRDVLKEKDHLHVYFE